MRRPTSLTSRLVLTSVGLVALVSLLVSVATSLAMRTYLVDRLDNDVQDSYQRLVDSAIGQGGGPPVVGLAAVFDESGDLVQGGYRVSLGATRSSTLNDEQLAALTDVSADGHRRSVEVPGLGTFRVEARTGEMSGSDVTVVAGLPMDDVQATLRNLRWIELSLGLAGVGLALAGSLWLVRRNLAPLREVAGVAQDVTRLDLATGSVGETVRVPDRLTDESTEVGQVGASLNSLLGHVEQALDARERSEQQVRQFVADASHELRTPLTTIRGYAELAGRNPEALPTSMTKVYEESRRMSALVDDLLLLARLDSGRPLGAEPVDLTELVVSAVDDARVVDGDRHYQLDLPEEPVTVVGDDLRLHQVVTNLLGNVRAHTGAGTTVTAGLHVRGQQVDLTLHDTGPGLPAGVDVFDRFSRGDSSRTRKSGGAGLGLSLVSAIAKAHGGHVAVTSHPGNTTFTVTLPLA
ncbi:MAG: HAMP domain-containing sensor histidine kinase [Nocardioidaceae bacterium]